MKNKDLTSVLRESYKGDISLKDAKREIESASPLDIVLAELDLLDSEKGVELNEIKDIYLELADSKGNEILEKTDEGDLINRFVKEHGYITSFVKRLSHLSESLQSEENRILRKKMIKRIRQDVRVIRKHKMFEEYILFPKLKEDTLDLGVVVLENEHEELDKLLDELTRLLTDIPKNKKRIIENIKMLNYTILLTEFIENNFFYQIVLEEQKEIREDFVDIKSSDLIPEYRKGDRKTPIS